MGSHRPIRQTHGVIPAAAKRRAGTQEPSVRPLGPGSAWRPSGMTGLCLEARGDFAGEKAAAYSASTVSRL